MLCFLQLGLLKLLLSAVKVLVMLACGAGGKNEYCRPTRKVSKDTPKTKYELTPSKLAAKKAEKSRVGMGRRVKKA